jgi:hypothetical protein
VHVRIAGFTLEVRAADVKNLNVAPGAGYASFLVPPAPPDVTISVSASDGEADDARACLFDSGGSWRLYRHDDGFLFRFCSPALGPEPYKTARFSPDFSRGSIVLHRPYFAERTAVDPLQYPLDELLLISLLGQQRGVEIHSCGVVHREAGYLFVGQSGAGKSTMARLWLARRGVVILSDDRVVLRGEPDGVWMYGTPWHGEEPLASPARARLSRVFFLRQHGRNELTAVSRPEAVTRLFAAAFPPFHDRAAVAFTLDFLNTVLGSVPAYELRFTPTASVLDLITQP